MTDNKEKKKKSIRLPWAGADFVGRSQELKTMRDAFLEQGARAMVLYGPPGMGKTSLAVKFAESMGEEFEYAYTFDCRGGIWAEEMIFRLCQFLAYHNLGNFENILLSPIPMKLKLEFIIKILRTIKILIIIDEFDSLLRPEHGNLVIDNPGLKNMFTEMIAQCEDGARFIFTSSSRFDTGAGHTHFLELAPDNEMTPNAISGGVPFATNLIDWLVEREKVSTLPLAYNDDSITKAIELATAELSGNAMKALRRASAFEKPVPIEAMGDEGTTIEEVTGCGLAGSFEAGGRTMYAIHSLTRGFIKDHTDKEEWKSLLESAAQFSEAYARENGIIWHMLYAHTLYLEAMQFNKAAEIADFVTPTLLGWGQMDIALWLSQNTAQSAEGISRAKALYTLGCINIGQNQYKEAMEHMTESLGIFRSLSDEQGTANALLQTGTIHNNTGDTDKAIEFFEQALSIRESMNDKEGLPQVLNKLGKAYSALQQSERAIETYSRSAMIAKETGDPSAEALALNNISTMQSSMGLVEPAIESMEREVELLEAAKDFASLTQAQNRLGGLYFKKGDGAKALDYLTKSLRNAERIRSKELAAVNLLEIGRVHVEARQYKAAIKNIVIALAIFESTESESKETALKALEHIEQETGKEEFNRLNEEVLKELGQQAPPTQDK